MSHHDAYDRLVAAGAPPLPGDRFYRIRESVEGEIRVEVREQRPRGRSRLLARAPVYRARGSLLDAVVDAARSAVAQVAFREDLAELRGDLLPS